MRISAEDFVTAWFRPNLVDLIMSCVSSVRYQIRLVSNYIYPSRGLRQGDPLSPYLFLLCAEGLSSLLKFEKSAGNIIGVSRLFLTLCLRMTL
jgi:hypothetical protein